MARVVRPNVVGVNFVRSKLPLLRVLDASWSFNGGSAGSFDEFKSKGHIPRLE